YSLLQIMFSGYLFIPLIIFGYTAPSESYAVNRSSNAESHDWTYPEFGKLSFRHGGRSENGDTQSYHREAERNATLRRGNNYHKPTEKISRHKSKYKPSSFDRRKNTNSHLAGDTESRHYHTFEEIHEHVEEDDDGQQYQASEQIGTQSILHENIKDHHSSKKDEKQMKVKIKHHHHHHHHNHIKEMIKTVPQPYPVEKVVHVPIEKIVEKIVHVPKLVNVTVERIVHVPVEKIVEKIVHVPKPVQVPKPYVVEKIIEKIVHVPKPYPVLRTVPYPVEIKVPIALEKKVPVPYKVEVERKVPVYIRSNEPYKFEPSPFESYHQPEEFKYNMEIDHPPPHQPRDHEQASLPSNYYNRIYKSKELDLPPRIEDFQHTAPPQYRHEPVLKSSIEAASSGREPVALKLVGPTPQAFNITGQDLDTANSAPPFVNNSNFDLNPQESANAFRGIPFSLPFQFVQLQPMAFQSAINVELPAPSAVGEAAPK
ncbi:hypothetical protein KR059_002693, partial [Drosophila kikkawai]